MVSAALRFWWDHESACVKRIGTLRDTFALTLEGYTRVGDASRGDGDTGRRFLCRDPCGIVIWDTTAGDVSDRLFPAERCFATLVLGEWKAVLEETIRAMIKSLASVDPSLDPAKVSKDVLSRSSAWRPRLLHWFNFDIGAGSLEWAAVREWIEIRNCLVHRGVHVDQTFLDRLSDVKDDLDYPYRVGDTFSVNTGEIYHLLSATALAIAEWSRVASYRLGWTKDPPQSS